MTKTTDHWQHVYATKTLPEVSWYEPVPTLSLRLIQELSVGQLGPIRLMDAGGGDSYLVDHLLQDDRFEPEVLDLSATALARAQERLGENAARVVWHATNVLDFKPQKPYQLWHDRAAFHFLTHEADVLRYAELVKEALVPGGYLVMGTFSVEGPTKCSGLPVQQYDEARLTEVFSAGFEPIRFLPYQHPTPFGTTQAFLFGVFKRTSGLPQ